MTMEMTWKPQPREDLCHTRGGFEGESRRAWREQGKAENCKDLLQARSPVPTTPLRLQGHLRLHRDPALKEQP